MIWGNRIILFGTIVLSVELEVIVPPHCLSNMLYTPRHKFIWANEKLPSCTTACYVSNITNLGKEILVT